MTLEDLRKVEAYLRLSSQLPDDVVDGEGREVALKPPSEGRVPGPEDPWRSSISGQAGLLAEREVGGVEVPGVRHGVTFTFRDVRGLHLSTKIYYKQI